MKNKNKKGIAKIEGEKKKVDVRNSQVASGTS